MSRKPTSDPPQATPELTSDDKTPAPGGAHPGSPYLRRPLRRLEDVKRKPDTEERPDDTPPGKTRHEGDGGNE